MRSNASASTTAPLPFEEQDVASANWKQEVADRVAERRARQQQAAHVVDVRDPAQAHPAPDAERATRAARIAASVAARYAESPRFHEAFSTVQNNTSAHASALAHEPAAVAMLATPDAIGLEAAPHNPTETYDAPQSSSDSMRNDSPQLSVTAEAVDVAIAAPVVEDVFSDLFVIPQQPLPANLIPFPREIVAARRARPRLTERLKTVADSTEEPAAQIQLRIFEVDAPSADAGYASPSSETTAQSLQDAIYLDAQPQASAYEEHPSPTLDLPLPVATAGMLYARIAFCTMDDSNPTRSMLLRRIPAWWVSALPLGLGFLWAAFDEECLCWHDRMTSMYPRAY